ncbi:MAG TPA: MFS transporter [Methanocella sp.]|nr:MFS transporter [Methanocella sp.]
MTEIVTAEVKKNIWASPYFLLLVLALGVFMTALDSYIFVPALPTIVQDLNTSLDWVSWTMTIFMLFWTAIMPLAGKLSDIYGRKRMYLAGITLFTLGSIACSLSWDIYSLIAFRGLQAIGAGLVMPAAISALSSAVPEERKGKTMGSLMAMAAVAMIVGPNIGGFFIQHFGWRSVFYINIPLGLIAILLMLKFNESFGESKQKIDILGSVLLVTSLGALMLGLVRLETLPLQDITVWPLFAATALLTMILVLFEIKTVDPILKIPLISRVDVLSLNLAQLTLNLSLICVMIYVPSFAQYILKMNVQDSGTILTPLSVALMFAAITGGFLLDRFGAKIMLLTGAIVTTGAVIYLAEYVTDSTSLAIALATIGIGLGLGMGAFQIIMLTYMPDNEKGTGTGIMITFKNIGSTVGSVIGGFFLSQATRHEVTLGEAFHNVFWIGVYSAAISVALITILITWDRRRKATKPVTPIAQQQ